MKKVICIDDSPSRKHGHQNGLKFNNIYTVTDESKCPINGVLHYQLAEMDPLTYYGAFRFVFTSEIDETELAEQRELQTV